MPVLFIEAPPGIRPEAKRTLMKKLYPTDNVVMDWRIQAENPKILEALKKVTAAS